ncbi:unnamed protein product [Dicrocoelium dendriticum]|nr:unnamed protein product [Dicrocoelium dendriticum]
MTVEEYQVAQLYAVAEASKQETGGGDGVEILVNEPFSTSIYCPNPPLLNGDPQYTTGQYTYKCYHLAQKMPSIVRALAPSSALTLNEVAWNAYPYCRTVLTNSFLGDSFSVKIESLHSSDITLQNAHQLSEEVLAERDVIIIDIGNITPADKDYRPDEDPTTFQSQKTGRGPLKPNWWLYFHLRTTIKDPSCVPTSWSLVNAKSGCSKEDLKPCCNPKSRGYLPTFIGKCSVGWTVGMA